jgi:hypothetical protein
MILFYILAITSTSTIHTWAARISESNVDDIYVEVTRRWSIHTHRTIAVRSRQSVTGTPLVITTPIRINDEMTVPLIMDLAKGDDVYVTALSFARKHGVFDDEISAVVESVTGQLRYVDAALASHSPATIVYDSSERDMNPSSILQVLKLGSSRHSKALENLSFLVDTSSSSYLPLRECSTLKPFSLDIILAAVTQGDSVVDVGAHMGYRTVPLLKAIGQRGKV